MKKIVSNSKHKDEIVFNSKHKEKTIYYKRMS